MITHNYLHEYNFPESVKIFLTEHESLMDTRLDPAQNTILGPLMSALDRIPDNMSARPVVRNGYLVNDTADTLSGLDDILMQYHPWRKGPYQLANIIIETEWRSDYKWNRLQPFLPDLANTHILDIGSGNGYHCWRMALEGAKTVTGIDPFILNVVQFHVMKKFFSMQGVSVLPLAIEELPLNFQVFDAVFSMGVLYHRKSPLEHLVHVKSLLKPGGFALLETLVIDGPEGMSLVPEDRYGKMRNVWFIPTPASMLQWMKRCGLKDCTCVDVSPTTTAEQRATPWMQFESLPDFLDKNDPSRTVEGYPAPVRAIFTGRA